MTDLKIPRDNFAPLASIFVLTTGLLSVIRIFTPLDILLMDRFFPGWGWLQIFVLGIYSSWIGAMLLRKSKSASKVRSRIWALFSLVFFAQLALGLMGIDRLLMTGDLHIPVPALIAAGPVYRGGQGLFMVILFGVSLLLAGPAWCSWLCYIGAWDDQSSRIRNKRPSTLPAWSVWVIRPGLLILVLGAAYIMNKAGVNTYSASVSAIGFGLTGVLIMLIFSRRSGTMVHCSGFCPMGLIANILGRINPWRIRIKEGCTRCGVCAVQCPYSALTMDNIYRGRPGLNCTLCGDCVNACPESVMEYRLPLVRPETARTAFIVLVVSLHAVFLATARI